MSILESELIAKRWSSEETDNHAFSKEVFWMAVPEVKERIKNKMTQGKYDTWVEYCLRTFIKNPPAERMVSFGCGEGELERQLCKLQASEQIDAYDIAPRAITRSKLLAEKEGIKNINYHLSDIHQLSLGNAIYDAVWFNGSLHHIKLLEKVFKNVATMLKPDGFLFFNEYIGPSRFALSQLQKNVIIQCFELIPDQYKRSFVPHNFGEIGLPAIPDPKAVMEADPSEAVRSDEIMDTLKLFFDIKEFRGFGGTILQFLLHGIAGNFNSSDVASIKILEMLFTIEDALIECGYLQHDFAIVIATPKHFVHS